jgi:hypothetical protein
VSQQGGELANPADRPDYGNCLRCGQALELMGIEQFRVGGSSGGWKLLFGELAELGEDMLELEVFACPYCRKVELRAPVQ